MQTKLFHVDPVGSRGRRMVSLLGFDSDAVKISKQETIRAQEVEKTKQEQIKADFREKLVKLGVPWEKVMDREPAENPNQESEEIEGPTTNLNVLHRINPKLLRKIKDLDKKINAGLAGENMNNKIMNSKKKKKRLQLAYQDVLQELDPTYVMPRSGDYSQETEKVIAKLVKNELGSEVLGKIESGDVKAELLAAKKIKEIYKLLDAARNLHRKDIRKNARNRLGFAIGAKAGEHREGLKRGGVLGMRPKKFEKLKSKTIKSAKETSETTEEEKKSPLRNFYTLDKDKRAPDEAFRPESKFGKAVYYGPLGIPALAHRAILRPLKLALKYATRNLIVRPTSAAINFILDKTFRKGPVVGVARSALWIGGSAMSGGLPIIPVITEAVIWAFKKSGIVEGLKKRRKKNKEKPKKPLTDSKILNTAHIASLGIPALALEKWQQFYKAVKLKPKKKEEK